MEVGNGVYQRAYETANGGRAVGVAYAATGGPIHGPGGPTDDAAGLWALSNGEHVWTAAEVAAAGGHGAVEELRQEVLSNGRGRAAGGPIEMSLALDQQQALIDMGGYAGKFIGGLVAMGSRVQTAGPAGPMGGGSVDGGWRGLFADVKAAIPQARINSTYRPGDPGYHGRDMAVDFGFGSGPGGAGSAGLASINRLIYDRYGSNMLELIYDGVGDDRPDLKNMRPHTYNQATQREHQNHVHAVPREHGGPVDPSVMYRVGERGEELVHFPQPGVVYPHDQATRLLTPAGSPGYGPAGTGGHVGFTADELAAAIVRALPDPGPLLSIGSYQEAPQGPRDLAQELVYQERTIGRR